MKKIDQLLESFEKLPGYEANSMQRIETRQFLIDAIAEVLEDVVPEDIKCEVCGKIITDNERDWEGSAFCKKCEDEENGFSGGWDDIGYNDCVKEVLNKIKEWKK